MKISKFSTIPIFSQFVASLASTCTSLFQLSVVRGVNNLQTLS